MAPYIIVDSAAREISYFGSQWQAGADPSTSSGTFNSTTTNGQTFPSLSYSTWGSAIAFYGHPSDDFKVNYTIGSINNKGADISFPQGTKGKTGVRWWSIDNLNTTFHSVRLKVVSGQVTFDYIVVTPDNATSLYGKTLALDDNDSSIQYRGNWISESGTAFNNGFAFQNTRRGTTNKGDSFSVSFTGSSVAVYGLLNQQAGKLSSTYTIDGGAPTTFTAFNGSQRIQPDNWLLHQKFFSQDLSPGVHNLTVTVNEVTGSQAYWLDYVTFQGSSDTSLGPPRQFKPSGGLIAGLVIAGIVVLLSLCCCKKHGKTVWVRVHHKEPYASYPPPPPPPPPVPVISDYEAQRLRMDMERMRYENEISQLRTHQAMNDEAQRLRMENMRLENEMIRLRNQESLINASSRSTDVEEQQRLRAEMENLRQEMDETRLRTQQLAAQSARREREEDAGPGDAPPAYNPGHYIP